MEIKSVGDVNAKIEHDKLKRIEALEKKLKRLSYVPTSTLALLLIYGFGFSFIASGQPSIGDFFLLAAAIGVVGNANVQRVNLLKELFELKNGK
ncbi:MAG: hypothetical protein ACTJIB_20755 [Pseudoalteromonas prydzensis]|uniref:Uncharacterized protein n=1 Tax=Pseudoalteromonas prydzensis TaxID=182141 RepID=A0ABR9FNU9_9GAMM|nr:hypothetical protein [Pseudoalteromonas prydzensis]MBE0458485.1 hypothetical protein [Pseudoalteromonas prydzensis]